MVDYSVVEMTPSEVLSGGPRRGAHPSLFVAYRMNSEKSREFRRGFELTAANSKVLRDYKVTDGHVPTGEYWAKTIRDRIKRARLVIADLTGPSKEVLFEAGFAYGLRKPLLPVVAVAEARDEVPTWLTPIQIGTYESQSSLARLASDVSLHLTRDGVSKPPRPPDPTPSLAVWLRCPPWAEEAYAQFEATAHAGEMITRKVEIPAEHGADIDDELRRLATSATFLVACLDGTRADSFVHYVCGAIVARPTSGMAKSKLDRRLRLLTSPEQDPDDLVADSARKCIEVKLIQPKDVLRETKTFAQSYRRWAKL